MAILLWLSHKNELVLQMQAGAQVLAASERPLVVVIEEAEAVDTLTLQDLILVLSEVRLCIALQHGNPVTQTSLWCTASIPCQHRPRRIVTDAASHCLGRAHPSAHVTLCICC